MAREVPRLHCGPITQLLTWFFFWVASWMAHPNLLDLMGTACLPWVQLQPYLAPASVRSSRADGPDGSFLLETSTLPNPVPGRPADGLSPPGPPFRPPDILPGLPAQAPSQQLLAAASSPSELENKGRAVSACRRAWAAASTPGD